MSDEPDTWEFCIEQPIDDAGTQFTARKPAAVSDQTLTISRNGLLV